MATADLVWGGLFLAGTAFEVYALRNRKPGGTLSEETRRLFRVRTRAGALTFGILWVSFASWFFFHVLWDVPFPGF